MQNTTVLSFEECLRDRMSFETSSAAASRSVYLGRGTALCRVANRFKMYVPTHDVSLVPHLMLEGYWESWISVAFYRVVRLVAPGSVANIGANLGYYSFLAAALLPNARVDAYEPQPALVELIKRSAIVNGFSNLVVHPYAVGAAPGSAWLQQFGDYLGSAMVTSGASAAGSQAISVEIRSLDQEGLQPLEMLVIDAEGYEFEILRGAQNRINASDRMTVFLEFSASRYADKLAFVDWIKANGFWPYKVTYEGKLQKLSFDDLYRADAVIDLVIARHFSEDFFNGLM